MVWTFLSIPGLALTCVLVLDIVHGYLKSTRLGNPLPPGPQGLPVIGNATAFTSGAPWLTYARWAQEYGDLVYFRFLGQDFIVVNSAVVAKDLLENRSRNYSDRPYLVTRDMCGRDFSTIFMEYGNKWRLHRRFFHQTFRREAMISPDQFPDHIFEYTGSIILGTVYDYDAKSRKDELFDIILRTLSVTVRAMRPDVSLLVSTFPAILKLPSWLPGMSFKQDMAIAKAYSRLYVEKPFEYSLQRLSAGICAPSMISDAFQTAEEKGTVASAGWTKDLSDAAATGFLAGAETSNSIILLFLWLMAENPEVQKNAQAQVDAVVGRHRLPVMEDRPLLPYVDAVFRETMRYYPIVPLAVPHAVIDDDIYAGYHIPKGALVVPNLWSMSHNESKYPKPDEFIPERFLNDDGTLNSDDLENIIFGFGRRICVGRHFADMSVWSVIVTILAVFSIEKARDENGAEIPIEQRFSNGITIRPLPFRCSIVPRIPGMDAGQLEKLIEAGIV